MPRRKSSLADDLVLVPLWLSLILAVFAFAFMKAMPRPWSAFAPFLTLFFLATGALSALRSLKTARMLERQNSLNSLRELPWKTFEDLMAEAYRRQGYKVEETLGGGPDGGVDLVLGRNGSVTVVQCKRWSVKQRVKVQTVDGKTIEGMAINYPKADDLQVRGADGKEQKTYVNAEVRRRSPTEDELDPRGHTHRR